MWNLVLFGLKCSLCVVIFMCLCVLVWVWVMLWGDLLVRMMKLCGKFGVYLIMNGWLCVGMWMVFFSGYSEVVLVWNIIFILWFLVVCSIFL